MTVTPADRDSTKGRPGKKPYRSPRLYVYGNIRDITQGFGNRNTRDGQGGSSTGFKSLP
jgi:hypothetical protein